MTAGLARSIEICDQEVSAFIEEDPIYRNAYTLAAPYTVVAQARLQNIFLIMKYALEAIPGDILELGSYQGGSALFMALVARDLNLRKTVYALDTFSGMPCANKKIDLHKKGDFKDAHLKNFKELILEHQLTNLVPIKGLFQKTLSKLLPKTPPLALAHIDCDIYESVHYSIQTLKPHMSRLGGYLIFDDAQTATCLGATQALEECLAAKGYRADQINPHFVYRIFEL